MATCWWNFNTGGGHDTCGKMVRRYSTRGREGVGEGTPLMAHATPRISSPADRAPCLCRRACRPVDCGDRYACTMAMVVANNQSRVLSQRVQRARPEIWCRGQPFVNKPWLPTFLIRQYPLVFP